MSVLTNIEWCDSTFNPWTGCAKVSAGCANCYAEAWAKRSGHVKWGKGETRILTQKAGWRKIERLQPILQDHKPHAPKVFSASLADWLDPEVPAEFLAEFLDLIRRTPHLQWLLLTKRPEWFSRRMEDVTALPTITTALRKWINAWDSSSDTAVPPANVWVGTTVENNAVIDARMEAVCRIPAVLRFISAEPLLERINLRPWLGKCVQWVIVGGESGPGHRTFEVEWATALAVQCLETDVPIFIKQDNGMFPGGQGRIPDALWSMKQSPPRPLLPRK